MNSKVVNSFGTLHPFVLLIYFAGIIITAMFSMNPVILTFALFGGVAFMVTQCSKNEFFSDLFFYIPMFLLIAIINPLFSHKGVTPIFFMNGNPVTVEAILYGVDISLMLVSVIYWCKCYSKMMTVDKFLFLFGKAAKKLSLVLSMSIRFIPLFRDNFREIRQVQMSLGLYNKKGILNKLSSELKVFSALITKALENSADTSASMRARGYGLKGRSHFSLFKFRKRDLVFTVILTILFSVTITGFCLGVTDFTFYPHLDSLRLDIVSGVVYISFGILAFLPFITEIREVIVWKLSVSKI